MRRILLVQFPPFLLPPPLRAIILPGLKKGRERKKKKRKIFSCIEPTVNHCNGANEKKKKKGGGGSLIRNNRGKDDSRIEILIYNFFLLLLFTYNLDNERDLITRKGFGLISDNY